MSSLRSDIEPALARRENHNGNGKQKASHEGGSWLAPYADAWTAQFSGTPNMGELARYFRPLHLEHGKSEVLRRWKAYLSQAEAPYANPARFSQTYGSWGGGAELCE